MGYYEFTITLADESRDAVMQRLSASGCLGFIEYEKSIVAYFHDVTGINNIIPEVVACKTLLENDGLELEISFDYVYISERDWNESWKKKFKPVDAGERFSVLPPWEDPKKDRINLIIDPGMAFGTGHHETTRTCLMLIERFSRNCAKDSFLDVGTGTGILAIAASRLGVKRVAGVDIDPNAIDAARRNAKLNNLDNILIQEGTAAPALGTFDFVAANLMSEILIRIAPDLAPCLEKGGIALLSGMLAGQEDGVIAAMQQQGLEFMEKHVDGRWVSLVMTR
ncbi:MAG: 50S ribosomal protein L11 methyltransferase [Nitrospirae bacterium]|nr:50S ribosomal protein L11 methyltransferase [Nitrospirota bacterium]